MEKRIFCVDFYPHEWVAATSRLTLEQRGLFIQIVSLIYSNRGPIENDPQWIGGVSGCSTRMAKTIIQQLSDMDFIQFSGSKIGQKRAENELKSKRKVLEKFTNSSRKVDENSPHSIKNSDLQNSDSRPPRARVLPTPPIEVENELPFEYNNNHRVNHARSDEKSLRAERKNQYRLSFDYSTGQFSGELDAMGSVWAEAYPAVDIAAEIRKAKAWMLSNPKNKKTNIPRFLSTWLAKAQDRASNANIPRSAPVTFAEQSRRNTETVIEKLRREAQNGELY